METGELSRAIVVAIDGPSGSGKSSVSKGVAHALGLAFLDTVIDALGQAAAADGPESVELGALATLAQAIADGNAGVSRIPGKHGGAQRVYGVVTVLVPDAPGELARLLTEVGEAGVNLEDLHLEHGIGAPVGLAELAVLPAAAEPLTTALLQRGWRVHD